MTKGTTGITTGTCAAAAAKAATILLTGGVKAEVVEISLPNNHPLSVQIVSSSASNGTVISKVEKYSGDDPDVTDGCIVEALVEWNDSPEVVLCAGEGVGTVTKPGLAVAPGMPAINPTPRSMIISSVREITDRGIKVTISIPNGRRLAEKTFNPRLGIVGGLSILGTSGIVRPFSSEALKDSLKCSLSVAVACRVNNPVFTPGRIGAKAAHSMFNLSSEQLIEVSNEWGFILDNSLHMPFSALLVLGHPGKLAKLAMGSWDTHSSRSPSAVPFIIALCEELFGYKIEDDVKTVEAVFGLLDPGRKRILAERLSSLIGEAVRRRIQSKFKVSVILVDLQGNKLGGAGDSSEWPTK